MLAYWLLPIVFFSYACPTEAYAYNYAYSHMTRNRMEEREEYHEAGSLHIQDSCTIRCNTSAKYRNIDGSCNNFANPCWGKSFRTFNTLLPLKYSDKIGCRTMAAPGTKPLPLPRLVSRTVHRDRNKTSHKLTDLFFSFGQFQTHDTGLSPERESNLDYVCPLTKNDRCPGDMEIPAGDPFWPSPGCTVYYSTVSYICNGTGAFCGCKLCKPGQVQYSNGATSFLDGSAMYGVTKERLERLRVNGSGELRMDGDLLARTSSPSSCVASKGCNSTCFDMGDTLGNANFLLTSMHTTWFKEHNRLMKKLKPYFGDPEILFQEARKIIGAMIQHITYTEYVPLLFGNCTPPDLKVPTVRKDYGYHSSLDPTMISECNFAACRYGHSLIRGFPKLYRQSKVYNIGNHFNLDPFCQKSAVTNLVGGMTEDRAMEMDTYVTAQMTDFLSFHNLNYTDLVAIGLQRARDHAVPSYITMIEYCGLPVPRSYDELKAFIPDETVEQYRQIYGEDGMINIDLYSAILSEKPTPDCTGILGQVTRCIVYDHYRRVKLGDRLWYENLDQSESLTKEQLHEIQKTTISRIVWTNTNLPEVQKHAFLIRDENNPLISCQKLAKDGDIDATKWK